MESRGRKELASLSEKNRETREENDRLVGANQEMRDDIEVIRTKMEETLDSAEELRALFSSSNSNL